MKEPKTTFKDLEQAYREKVMMVYNPQAYWHIKKYNERKDKGICVECGMIKITKFQRKQGLVVCLKCRKRRVEARNEKRQKEVKENVRNI